MKFLFDLGGVFFDWNPEHVYNDKFNSKEVKSIVLDPSSSATASMFGQKVYWKINRKNGVAGIYAASNNKMVSEKFNCKIRPGL